MNVKKDKKVRHFTDLVVWKKAHNLFVDIFRKTGDLPRQIGVNTIVDQILRSCGSISANIAEGFNTRTTKHYIHYLDTALNSASETENWLYKIKDCNLLANDIVIPWLDVSSEIEKMLQKMIQNLSKKLTTSH